MTARRTPRLSCGVLAAYCILLFAVWTLREFFLREEIEMWLGPWGGAVVNAGVKVLLWTAPALWLMRRYQADLWLARPFAAPKSWRVTGLCVLAIVVYFAVTVLIGGGSFAIHPSFRPESLIGTVLLVGITEETVFRGFLLGALLRRQSEKTAVVLASLLFVLIHFPLWIHQGLLASPLTFARSCVTIFALGVLFSWLYCKEESLWPPIVVHMFWNLFVLLFAG